MPIPKKATDELKKSQDHQDKATEALENALDAFLQGLKAVTIAQIARMSGKDTVKNTKKTQGIVAGIRTQAKRQMKDKRFEAAVLDYLRTFEEVETHQIFIHESINTLGIPKKMLKETKQFSLQLFERNIRGKGFMNKVVEPYIEGIQASIVRGVDFGDLITQINAFGGGPGFREAKQVARDSLSQFEGAVNKRIADEFGLEWFTYVGSLIATSRPQCRRWVEFRYLHTSEIQDEIEWMENNGTGAIKGTTQSNFQVLRGGYGCRHSVIALASEVVPDSAFERVGIDRPA